MKVEMRFLASAATQEKIETLKGWLAHENPQIGLGELFEKLCNLGLQEWNPSKLAAPRKHRVQILERQSPKSFARRTPSAQNRRLLFEKAQNQCQNCGSRHALEVDHIRPWALGGFSNPENLRVLCRSCNQRAAIKTIGAKQMAAYLDR